MQMDSMKRTCLYCFVHMNSFHEASEWHSFFSCPCNTDSRWLFIQAFPRFYNVFFPSHEIVDSPVVSMAKIFQEAQFNRYLTNELARFVNGILVGRRKAFSSMSKGGPLSLLSCALDVLGDEPSQS